MDQLVLNQAKTIRRYIREANGGSWPKCQADWIAAAKGLKRRVEIVRASPPFHGALSGDTIYVRKTNDKELAQHIIAFHLAQSLAIEHSARGEFGAKGITWNQAIAIGRIIESSGALGYRKVLMKAT